MRAYIMISGKRASPNILERIRGKIPCYSLQGHEVYGVYDVVIEAEAENLDELFEIVMEISRADVVGGSTTYIVAREGTPKEIGGETFAYVLVDCDPELTEEVFERISDLREVRRVDIVFGPFDAIVDVVVSNLSELNEAIRKIIDIEGVRRTTTLISFLG